MSDTLLLWLFGLLMIGFLPACQQIQPQVLPTLNPVAEIDLQATPLPAAINEIAPLVGEVMAEETDVTMDQGKEIVISVWHTWQGPAAEALTAVIAAYEAAHPDTRLELIFQDSLLETVQTAVPAGEGPDLLIMTADPIGRFAADHLLSPVSPYFDPTYLTNNFTTPAAAAMTWQDEVWGLPLLQEGIALIYNPALLENGALPKDGTDFAALLTSAQTFHAAHPDSYLFCNESLSATSLDAYHSAPIFFGFGGPEETGYIDDWGTVRINTPERLAAANWLQELAPAVPVEVGYEICLDGFQSGKFAAWWTGPWSLDALREAGTAYAVQGFGRPYVHVTGLFLGANAPDRQHDTAAAEFMAYWASAPVQTRLALAAGAVPASRAALQSPEVQANQETTAFAAALTDGIPFPTTPYVNAQWEPLAQATTAILGGEQLPAEALANAQTAVEQAINDMKEQ